MKIIRTDCELETPLIDAKLRELGANLVLLPTDVSEERLIEEVCDAEILLMCYTPISAALINTAYRLKAIVKYGVGIDAIDIDAARARHIPVVNIPEYAESTVAEGAFTLMLALAKNLIPMDHAMHQHGWLWPSAPQLGKDIAQKTVGLVGAGRIGCAMARMAGAGFGAHVIGFDPGKSAKEMEARGIEKYDDLNSLLAVSDFVSLHCVLNKSTTGLIGESELAVMKPTAFLINTARGALVDEYALVQALTAHRIAGAGLDVYSKEPLSLSDHPMSALFKMPNVILLPHLTFYTHEAMQRLEQETLERCREVMEGRPVTVNSHDPRLRSQTHGVTFGL